MPSSIGPDFEALHRAALKAMHGWSSTKTAMALRAVGLDSAGGGRASLDAIAADHGVSRETVRRARNELLQAMQPSRGATSDAVYASLALSAPSEPSPESPATARALRRLLTMTGPLPWDEMLSAWARAGGRPPYSPLPTDLAAMCVWASQAGGFSISAADQTGGIVAIATMFPEGLDQVSQFLLDALREQAGVDRNALLEQAESAGLKSTTIATALSMHPAVVRVGRGLWALRGHRPSSVGGPARMPEPRRAARVRPTTFTWSIDGLLLIEFSIPRGPSPVVAVPKAVFEIVEGREFTAEAGGKPLRVAMRGARMWGFGSLLSDQNLPGGARVTIALNLITGTATITPAEGKRTPR